MNIQAGLGSRFLALLFFLVAATNLQARQSVTDIGFSGQFFFSFEHNMYEDDFENEFALKRGYITFRKDLSEKLQVRFTQDVSIDRQGDGEGDIELRLKYALVKYRMRDLGFFSSPEIEVGVVHRPWIDFEQDVNDFRAQKEMFLDQNGFLSSADYGVTFVTGLGGELDEEKKHGLASHPGKYGSFGFGLYNGGGYSALEKNRNKLLEVRLSLRPFHEHLPGLQTSFFGVSGKGNTEESPDFRIAGAALSYESAVANLMVQSFTGVGDGAGAFVDPQTSESYGLRGWSAFTDIRPFRIPLSITFRYDDLYNNDLGHRSISQVIAGIGYIFKNRSKIMLDVSDIRHGNPGLGDEDFTRIEVVTEIRF